MKKCPSCYAIMRETISPFQVPKKPPEAMPVNVRYGCSQSDSGDGDLLANLAVSVLISKGKF
jgi:hypothetical protein